MKTPSTSSSALGVLVPLGAFAAVMLTGRALGLPFPVAVVLGLALALRVGVVAAALAERHEAPAPPVRPAANEPALRAATRSRAA